MVNNLKTKEKKITYKDVADYFLAFANERGEQLTNLKLQKLVYYAQAWHLANFSKPLFKEDFQAWVHGPVLPDLYDNYKGHGSSPIVTKLKMKTLENKFNAKTVEFLDEVASVYMQHGAYELELMTHQEDPWIEARGGCEPDEKCKEIISQDSMMEYYGQKIK